MILITSTILNQFPNLKMFMSGKKGGVSIPPFCLNLSYKVNDIPENVTENRKLFFNSVKVNTETLAIPKQIHSNTVKIITEPGKYPDCDALITNTKNLFLSVSVADCVPIFLFDKFNEVISAVHSGWKGSYQQILTNTLNMMADNFHSKPDNIYAYIGPSAGKCCYEVDSDVSSNFHEKYCLRGKNGKSFLDIKQVNYDLLKGFGLPAKNIEMDRLCTICNPDILHSYRRDKDKSGRMMGIIGMIY